jgi:anti-sigma B factor antagonist
MTKAPEVNTLTFQVENKDGSALVHCRGRLVAGLTGKFYEKICPLLREHKRVVLDLTDLTSVDSLGLGVLVRLHVSAKSAGSCIELINLGKQVKELLGITNLLSLFAGMCESGISMRM